MWKYILCYSENVGASKQQSTIFKWENGSFKIYQSLLTEGAQSWEYFQIGKQVSGVPGYCTIRHVFILQEDN